MLRNLFVFERAEYSNLEWMPLALRHRLDVSGLKLGLAAWQKLSFSDRALLLDQAFESPEERRTWAEDVKTKVLRAGGSSPGTIETWVDSESIPPEVAEKLSLLGGKVDANVWKALPPVQRYALCKLARSKAGGDALLRALREFVMTGF